MAASRPKKLKIKLKKGAASRRQKAKKRCFYLSILLKKNPGWAPPCSIGSSAPEQLTCPCQTCLQSYSLSNRMRNADHQCCQ